MTKRRREDQTIDMWSEFTPPDVDVQIEAEVTRGGTLDVKIARAISHAMQSSDLGREEIAKRMSEFLVQNVTENMLDQYASPARTDSKITLARFIALVEVTGCHDLLGFVAGFSDFAVVPDKYVDVIKLDAVEDRIAEAIRYRDTLAVKVKAGKR